MTNVAAVHIVEPGLPRVGDPWSAAVNRNHLSLRWIMGQKAANREVAGSIPEGPLRLLFGLILPAATWP